MFPSGGSEKRCLLPKKGFATPRCIWRFCLFARGRVFRRFAAGFSAGSLQNGICSTGLPPPTANGSAHKAFPLRAICFRFFALYFYFSRRLPPRAFLRCFSCLRRSTAGFRKKPYKTNIAAPDEKDAEILTADAAAMWQYYTRFCNERNHFLPPDNVQETPVLRVAHRTSRPISG